MSDDPGQPSGQQTPGPVGTDPRTDPAPEGRPLMAYDIDGNPMPDYVVEDSTPGPTSEPASEQGRAPEHDPAAGSDAEAPQGRPGVLAYGPDGQPLPAYDAHGRPLLVFDAHGRPLTAYDVHGRPVPAYDAQGRALTAYDAHGRPMIGFDAAGRPLPGFAAGGYPPPGYYGAMPPPPPPPPPADVAKRFTRLGRRSMWLGGFSLVLALFFYPLGIVAGIAGLVLGLLALRAARPFRAKAPGAVPGVVMGIVGLVFSLMVTAFAVYLYDEISTYSKCRDAANTVADENQCKDNFARSLEKKLHLKPGTVNARNMPF